MSENKIRIEDHNGNIYYPHTKSDVVFMENGKSVESEIVSHKDDTTKHFSVAEKTKLAGVESGANKYIHPSSHPATMITGLASVAKSGNYNDLSNKPTSLPANGGNADTLDGVQGNNYVRRDVASQAVRGPFGVTPENDVNEGGHIILHGANGYVDWNLDSYHNEFRVFDENGKINLLCEKDKGVKLGYNNATKFETRMDGINIVGDIYNDGIKQPNMRVSGGKLQYYDGGWKDVGGSPIKSIQRGTYNIPSGNTDIIISEVDLNKATLITSGDGMGADGANHINSYGYLLNSTTIRLYRDLYGGTTPIAWQVVEYN